MHRLMGVRHCGAHSLIKQLVEVLFREGPRPGGPPDTSPPHRIQRVPHPLVSAQGVSRLTAAL